MSDKMVNVNLGGLEVKVPSCGKFEVEWALANIMLKPGINLYDLRVALEKHFTGTAPEEARGWVHAAHAKFQSMQKEADANGANVILPELGTMVHKVSIHRLRVKGSDIYTGWRPGASNLSQQWLDDHNMEADDREISFQDNGWAKAVKVN